VVLFAIGVNTAPAHASDTASIWIQTLDSCNHTLGGSQYDITDSSQSVDMSVNTPATSLHLVGGACPAQRGNCASATYGCVQITGLPDSDTFSIRETALPPANSGNPLGFAACNGGSACRAEYATFATDSSGNVVANTLNAYPDGTVAVMPTGSVYAATAGDPIVFHNFGLGSGSCDGDTDADDHLTGGAGSHCAYQPESAESTACQTYPWSCTQSPSALHFALSTPSTLTAGTSFTETITAQDLDNNAATSYSGSQTLIWSGPSKSPSGASPKYPANPVTFSNGVAQVAVTLVDAQTTPVSVTQDYISGTSLGISVAAGTPTKFAMTAPAQALAGTSFQVSLRATDNYGNAVTYAGDKTLSWSGPSSSPNRTAPVYPSNPVTFTNASASVSVTLFDAQTTKLSVTDGVIKGASPITVSASSAGQLSLTTPATQTAGATFNETITAADTYGNTITGYAGAKTLNWSGPSNSPDQQHAPVYPSNPLTFTSGVASGSITLYNAKSGTTLSVTDVTDGGTGLTGSSSPFSVSPATWSGFALTNPATAPIAGATFKETITDIDAFGNTITANTGSQALTWSGPHNSPNGTVPKFPTSITFTKGVGSASVTLYNAETVALTVSQNGLSGTSPTLTVSPGATTKLAAMLPASSTAGSAVTATASALDKWGNLATADSSTLSVTSTDSVARTDPANPTSVTLSAGTVSFQYTFYLQGSQTITVNGEGFSRTSNATTVQ